MSYVKSYRKKNGTYVKGHHRRSSGKRNYRKYLPDTVRAGVNLRNGPYVEGEWRKKNRRN